MDNSLLSNLNKRRTHLLAAWIIGLALVFFLNQRASAQQATPPPSDDQVNLVAKQLYCPVCENISLDVCPTQACAQWRALIKEKLAAGWSDQQIKDYFVLQYGDRVLAEPPRRGLNWLVYILPPVFFILAAVILYRSLRGMRKPRAVEAGAAPEPEARPVENDPYLAKFEEEMRKKAQ
jgi:cytochrome c-type biogenesis protein CcmH